MRRNCEVGIEIVLQEVNLARREIADLRKVVREIRSLLLAQRSSDFFTPREMLAIAAGKMAEKKMREVLP